MEPATASLFASTYLVVSVVILVSLWIYRNKNDPHHQYLVYRRAAQRALAEPDAQATESAAIDAELAELPEPAIITPIRNEEKAVRLLPPTMLVLALIGLILVYLQLFHSGQDTMLFGTVPDGFSGRVALVLGASMLLACIPLYLLTEKVGEPMRRVQALRRKYVMQWTCGESALVETADALLAYFPENACIWAEKAEYLAFLGRIPEACAAIEKSGALEPDNSDYAFMEASYRLRCGDIEAAESAVARVKKACLRRRDPRPDVFGAVMAFCREKPEEALEKAEIALKKDREFTLNSIRRDPAMAQLRGFLEEKAKM